jgi:hypothetical protein
MMLKIRKEWRCDFGVCDVGLCDILLVQPVEPTSASSPRFIITMPEAPVVNLSSSDTKEALDLLFLSLAHGPHSSASNPRSGFDSDMLEDWPKVNNMAATAYVALTADASSSRASTIDTVCDVRGSCIGGSSGRQTRSPTASSKKPQRQKTVLTSVSWRKLKKMKIDAKGALVTPTSHDGSLSTANFDKFEWEIMYPLFVEDGLVDSFERVNRKDA